MSAPDPDAWPLLGKALGALAVVGAVVVAPIWKVRSWLDGRFARKADKSETDRCLGHIERLYQNAEADRAFMRDAIEKLGNKLHDVHVDLLNRISARKD